MTTLWGEEYLLVIIMSTRHTVGIVPCLFLLPFNHSVRSDSHFYCYSVIGTGDCVCHSRAKWNHSLNSLCSFPSKAAPRPLFLNGPDSGCAIYSIYDNILIAVLMMRELTLSSMLMTGKKKQQKCLHSTN